MHNVTFIIFGIILSPTLLFAVEFYLCKKKPTSAIILPIIVACFYVVVRFYALIISAIMFGSYFTMKYVEKEKQSRKSEFSKMSIQDLE